MISLKYLDLFIHQKQLLHQINLVIPKGKLIGLIGPNGAGKSTLMKCLAGIVPFQKGAYLLADRPIESYSPKARAQTIGFLAQQSTLNWPLTVEQLIQLGRMPYQGFFSRLSKKDKAVLEQVLNATDCMHLKHRLSTELSGGELTRVLIARVLAGEPDVLIADEPIASLDPFHQLQIMELLQLLTQQGKTVMVSLHDLNLAQRFCDGLVLMQEGRIAASGSVTSVLCTDNIADTYQVSMDWIEHNDKKTLLLNKRI